MLQIIATDVTLIQLCFCEFDIVIVSTKQYEERTVVHLNIILLFVFSMTIRAFDKIRPEYKKQINAKIQEIMDPEFSYMEEIKKRLGQLPG